MTTYSSVLQAAMRLTPRERSQLAESLWSSISDDEAAAALPQFSEGWKKEIARRSAEIDAGTAKYVTYEQMIARARRAAGHND
jgi:putative addiction module component (TIGR02574 family)